MDEKNLMKIFRAMSSEKRFLILKFLYKSKELSVGELSEVVNSPFRSVSKDLAILRSAELVQFRNFNLTKRYSINFSKFPKQLLTFLEN
jgi:DNA-binding transcriptional ArsR family regulator